MARNLLLITADDLNADACGCFGCPVPETTPHVDALASEGHRFARAHVTIAVCEPARGCMLTGRYPHRSGIEGFHPTPYREVPDLLERLGGAGYRLGCLGKVPHMLPKVHSRWHHALDGDRLGVGRDPARYRDEARAFIEAADRAGTPFFLAANSHDPHRPFHGSEQERKGWGDRPPRPEPSRVYAPDEITVPGFLPDLPPVRLELSEYYASVRRFDDTVGAVLRVLEETGRAEDTLVALTTDHGMPLPFAKTNCWYHSTRTPMIVRSPDHAGGRVDEAHFVSDRDVFATLLDAAQAETPEDIDGRSLLPLLDGAREGDRHRMFTQFHQTAAGDRYPMRAVHDPRYLYIFNPWSDGERRFRNESQAGRTAAAMQEAAETDPSVRERLNLFLYRELEELYDTEADPDCVHNLVGDATHADALDRLRGELRAWMAETGDRAVRAFDQRDDPRALAAFMAEEQAWGTELRNAGFGLAADPRETG